MNAFIGGRYIILPLGVVLIRLEKMNTDMQSVGSRFAGGAYYFVVTVVVGCGGRHIARADLLGRHKGDVPPKL